MAPEFAVVAALSGREFGGAGMNEDWYALYVKSRFEKYVTTQLEAKGYETYLPTYICKRKWSDRIKTLTLPLFPSYVFCRFDIHARLPVVIIPGVVTILGAGKSPIPIDRLELSAVRQITESQLQAQPHRYLAVGEIVRVETGPLEGLVGIILRTKGSDRLVVSVSLLMRSVSVEIDRNCVSPIRERSRVRTTLDQDVAAVRNIRSTVA